MSNPQSESQPSGSAASSSRWVVVLAATLVVVFALVFARFTFFTGNGTAEGPQGPTQLANASPFATATQVSGNSNVGTNGTVVAGQTPPPTPIVAGYPSPNVISAREQQLLAQVPANNGGKTYAKVIVISLDGQFMQAIQNGKIVRWTYVTTGRGALPTPPGFYNIFQKDSPLNFYPQSTDPANTQEFGYISKVQYGMAFAPNGYYIHEVWWRTVWGPGTQYDHTDPGRNENSPGSHGCVNTPLDAMVFFYQWADMQTPVIIYDSVNP